MTPKKYDFTKIKITPVSEKAYNGIKSATSINDEIGQGGFGCSFPKVEKINTFKLGKLFYLHRTHGILLFRLFGKYGLSIRDTTKTFTFFSERNGYKKFWDIGKYRIKILKY